MATSVPIPHVAALDHATLLPPQIQKILESTGYRVTTRPQAIADVDAIATLAPDVLILELGPLTLVDDWSLLLHVALDERTARTPIVVCTTAMREARVLSEALRDMGVAVVAMPFDPSLLLNAVRDGLRRGHPSAADGGSAAPGPAAMG